MVIDGSVTTRFAGEQSPGDEQLHCSTRYSLGACRELIITTKERNGTGSQPAIFDRPTHQYH
jgi:hypothetical protein